MPQKQIESIKKWCENTSFHGLPNIIDSKYIVLRIIWALVFLAAFSFSVYSITNIFMSYFSYSVLTTIGLVDSPQMSFPAITICNMNPFSTLEAVDFVSRGLNASLLSALRNDYFTTAIALSSSKRAELLNSNTNESFRRSMGLSLDSFVTTCYYNGKRCDLKNDFEWSYNSEFGNCFTFASSKNPKMSFKAGRDNGLIISLFVGLPDSIYTLSFFSGAFVFIHSPDNKPVRDQAIQAASGVSNSIGIDKEVYQRLGRPFRNCYEQNLDPTSFGANMTLYSATLNYTGVYNQAICLEYCYQYYILEKCGCLDINVQPVLDLATVEMCAEFSDILCMREGFVEFYEGPTQKLKCLAACPEQCELTQFQTQQTFSQYSENFLKYISTTPKIGPLLHQFYNRTGGFDEDLIRHSITTVYIYFDKLAYKLFKEVPQMQMNDLISGIGGVLGLLLGASALSMFEIVSLIFELVLDVLVKNCRASSYIKKF